MTDSQLRGLSVELVVSDPWDFVTAVGSGPFAASIVDERGSGVRGKLLLKLEQPVAYRGSECQYFIATARHDHDDVKSLLKDTAAIHVNAQRLDRGRVSDWETAASQWRGGLALIADLRKRRTT